MKDKIMQKVQKSAVDFQEVVEDFVGLVFHCPTCNDEMHLKIAKVDFKPIKITKIGK
jgi:hypothetical protein